MQSPPSLHPAYRRDIDGLRAIAVLSVVAFHAFPGLMPGGYIGVDIFFVISGFLISSIIFKGLEQGRFSFADFYARRIKRIFPALTLVLLFCLVCGWFVLLPAEYAQLGKHIAAGAGFLSNFILWLEAGYFDTTAEYKPLLHLWSLGIEEQFYIVWPLLLAIAWRLRLRLPGVIILIAATSFALNVARIEGHAVSTFYLPMTRIWELLAGALLAHANLHRARLPPTMPFRLPSDTQAVLGAMLFVIAFSLLDTRRQFPGWWALLPTVGAVLLISAGEKASINRVLLGNRVMVFVGLISYPLYLWHWPLLSFARILESGTPAAWIRITAVACSVLLAWLTYRFIELPIRRQRGMAVPAGLFIAAMLAGIAGYSVNRMAGIPERVPEQVAILENFEWNKPQQHSPDCLQRMATPGLLYCLEMDPDAPPTVALIGDSHANQYFAGLSGYYRSRGGNLINLGGGGCVPFLDLESSEKGTTTLCAKVMRKVFDSILQSPSIGTVILASRGPFYTTGRGFGEIDRHNRYIRDTHDPDNENYPKVFANAMERTLRRLHAAGKGVVFVLDIPELGFDPRSCTDFRPLSLTDRVRKPCAVPRSQVDERNREYRRIVQSVAGKFPGVGIFDPSSHLCDEAYCWAEKSGVILYRNDDHLSLEGSMFIAEKFGTK